MKVKELIEKLQTLEQDLPVYCEVCCEGYIDKVGDVEVYFGPPNRSESEMSYVYIVPVNYF